MSNVSKVFEKITLTRIVHFIDKNSTTATTYQTITDIYDGINERDEVMAIFIDLSKAFDRINYNILLDKMQKRGFRCKSYLSERS